MLLNVTTPPKLAAIDAASAAQTRTSPTDALVLHLYCDGSYKRGSYIRHTRPRAGVGIVANIWLPRDTTKQRTSKACFIRCDCDDDNNSTEAFALAEGAYVALDQISSAQNRSPIRSTDRIEVIFWSDSTNVLHALENQTRFDAQSRKTRHLLNIIKLKTYELQELRAGVSVHFRWCPQKCVEPHDIADHLSKRVRLSGGNTISKAVEVFKSVPYSSIEAELERKELPAVPSASPSSATAVTDAIASRESTTSPQNGGEPIQSSSSHPDLYDFIEIAAHELPVQHKEVVLAAIDLQKKVNAARTQDAAEDQDHGPKSPAYELDGHMQDAESDVHLDKSEGQSHGPKSQDDESDERSGRIEGETDEPEGRVSEQDGHVDENGSQSRGPEGQTPDLDEPSNGIHGLIDEPRSSEDVDVEDEPEVVEQARPNRLHTVWTWVGRRLPRL